MVEGSITLESIECRHMVSDGVVRGSSGVTKQYSKASCQMGTSELLIDDNTDNSLTVLQQSSIERGKYPMRTFD